MRDMYKDIPEYWDTYAGQCERVQIAVADLIATVDRELGIKRRLVWLIVHLIAVGRRIRILLALGVLLLALLACNDTDYSQVIHEDPTCWEQCEARGGWILNVCERNCGK